MEHRRRANTFRARGTFLAIAAEVTCRKTWNRYESLVVNGVFLASVTIALPLDVSYSSRSIARRKYSRDSCRGGYSLLLKVGVVSCNPHACSIVNSLILTTKVSSDAGREWPVIAADSSSVSLGPARTKAEKEKRFSYLCLAMEPGWSTWTYLPSCSLEGNAVDLP